MKKIIIITFALMLIALALFAKPKQMEIKFDKTSKTYYVFIDGKLDYTAKSLDDLKKYFDLAPWRPLTSDFWYYEYDEEHHRPIVTHCKFDFTYYNDYVEKACRMY